MLCSIRMRHNPHRGEYIARFPSKAHVNNEYIVKSSKVDDAFREFSHAKELDVNYPRRM